MGRKQLFYIRTHIAFSNEALTRMAKLTTEKGRAEYVRKAVDRQLAEDEAPRPPAKRQRDA